MEIKAQKDGKGNIIISEDSFEMILACLDNQKFISGKPQKGDFIVAEDKYWRGEEDIQNTIDHYNRECRKILHQKYHLRTESDGYFLAKRYEHQTEDTDWSEEDLDLVYELFKETKINYEQNSDSPPLDSSEELIDETIPDDKTKNNLIEVSPVLRTLLIEKPFKGEQYIAICDDGKYRAWKQDEIEKITKILNEDRQK